MKYLITILAIINLCASLNAQDYQLNLFINPNVSPYFDDWLDGNIEAPLQILQIGEGANKLCLGAEIYREGELVAYTNLEQAAMQAIEVQEGTNFITADLLFNSLEFNEEALTKEDKNYFTKTQRFPSGNYKICVYLRDCSIQNPFTFAQNCFPMFITAYQPPSLLFPEDEALVNQAQRSTITFNWSSTIPAYPNADYHIRLYELYEGQTKEQAALVNAVIWEQTTSASSTLLDLDDLPLDEGQDFVWQVQALDPDGQSVGEQDGFSEVNAFSCTQGKFLESPSMAIQETLPAELTYYEFMQNPLMPHDLRPCCRSRVDPENPCQIITEPPNCKECYFSINHRILTSGGGTGFGQFLIRSDDENCPFKKNADNAIQLKYSFMIKVDCEDVPSICASLSNFTCSGDTVEPVKIESLVYKNGILVNAFDPTLPYDGVSPIIAVKNYSLTFNSQNLPFDNDSLNISESHYGYSCLEYANGDREAGCAALVDLEITIHHPEAINACDKFDLVTYIAEHDGHQDGLGALLGTSTNATAPSSPSLSLMSAIANGQNTALAEHIDIIEVPIDGTKYCGGNCGATTLRKKMIRTFFPEFLSQEQ